MMMLKIHEETDKSYLRFELRANSYDLFSVSIGSVLENGNSMLNSSKSKNDKENQVLRSISLLSHQPFLSLVLSCLKDQDDQRTGLLDSLRGQLEQLYKQVS